MEATNKFITFTVLILATLVIFKAFEVNPVKFFKINSDSETASKVKKQLNKMFDVLTVAENTGDRAMALKVLMANTKVLEEFNALPESSKNKILTSELRYCHLASLNLFDGAKAIYEGNYWLQKDRFINAVEMCH